MWGCGSVRVVGVGLVVGCLGWVVRFMGLDLGAVLADCCVVVL